MNLLNSFPCPPGYELHNLRICFPAVYSEVIADSGHHMGYPALFFPQAELFPGAFASLAWVIILSCPNSFSLNEALPASSAGHIFATWFCVTALRCSPSWPRTWPVSTLWQSSSFSLLDAELTGVCHWSWPSPPSCSVNPCVP